MRKAPRIRRVESHRLAEGWVELCRMGRTYGLTRFYPDPMERPPEMVHGITKAEAYKRLEEILRADVLELE